MLLWCLKNHDVSVKSEILKAIIPLHDSQVCVVCIKQHTFYVVLSDASTQIASIYYENNEKLWQEKKHFLYIPLKALLLSGMCTCWRMVLYTNYVLLLVSVHTYIRMYTKLSLEECAYIFKCISAVNNDSWKIKAKCLHSFLLIL